MSRSLPKFIMDDNSWAYSFVKPFTNAGVLKHAEALYNEEFEILSVRFPDNDAIPYNNEPYGFGEALISLIPRTTPQTTLAIMPQSVPPGDINTQPGTKI
uniref:Uncharacterized protein n=1 Tax=Panagrolaimus davidi TaxID=227884 RepID=A0A914P7Y3_9BILA